MGRSQGARGRLRAWQLWVDDYATFNRMVIDSTETEVVPLGHSFGGVVAFSALLRGAIHPARLVVSNPALRPAQKVPALKARFGQIGSRLLPDVALSSGLDANHISRDPEVVRAYREDPLVHDRVSSRLYTEWSAARQKVMDRASSIEVPVLVICGSGDRLIEPSGSRDLAARLPRGLLKEYPERYHEPFNDYGSAEVFDDLATWLLRPPP